VFIYAALLRLSTKNYITYS